MCTIVFRADGGKSLGFGHLVRCAALAGAYQKLGFSVHFITRTLDGGVRSFFDSRSLPVTEVPAHIESGDADFHIQTMRGLKAKATVLDCYQLNDQFRFSLARSGMLVIAIDDLYQHYANADVVINHNPSCIAMRYDSFSGLKLLGPQYALLNPELKDCLPAPGKREIDLLILLGGTDNLNQLPRLLSILDTIDADFTVTSVGGVYDGKTEMKFRGIKVRHIPFTNQLPRIMEQCDAAITAGGVTCMELAGIGRPFLILATDSHQIPNAEYYAKAGIADFAGPVWNLNDTQIAVSVTAFLRARSKWYDMATKGKNLINLDGALEAAKATRPLIACQLS